MPHLNARRWAMFENNKYKVALIKNYNLIQRASRKSPKKCFLLRGQTEANLGIFFYDVRRVGGVEKLPRLHWSRTNILIMASVLQLGPASICQILVLNSTTMTTIPNRMLQLISAWRQRRSATMSDECDECAGNQFPPHCSLLPAPPLPPWSCCHTCSFVENMRFLFLGFPTTLNNCIINERVRGTDRQTVSVAFTPAQWSTK